MTLAGVSAGAGAVANGIPSGSGRMWSFGRCLPRSTGLGPVREPPHESWRVRRWGRPVQVPVGAEPIEDLMVQLAEEPGASPGGEAAVRGRNADSERRWQVSPRAPAGEHVDDSGEHGSIIDRCPSATLWPRREPRQSRFDDLPQRIRYQPQRQRVDHGSALCRTNNLGS